MGEAQAQMQYVGEIDGRKVYWAEPGRFVMPGIVFWSGTNNVHVPLPATEGEGADMFVNPDVSRATFAHLAAELERRGATVTPAPHGGNGAQAPESTPLTGADLDEQHGYHPGNLKLQPYPHFDVIALARHARDLGIQFKIAGIPFGAPYDKHLWDKFLGGTVDGASGDGAQATQSAGAPDGMVITSAGYVPKDGPNEAA